VKAVRNAAVSEVGAKIESAIGRPNGDYRRGTAEAEEFCEHAETASNHWRSFTKIFRWQQLAIAVLAGIVIGGAGTWYFASLPLKEAQSTFCFSKMLQPHRRMRPKTLRLLHTIRHEIRSRKALRSLNHRLRQRQ